ncbi:hypothetical protein HYDPIDRAFT_131707 [Hydnomerulius pinastri MD-312]|uniref:PARP catalytic domain-containing protein n=1 Tax=Hydnomerulius pinastri MD-312 TaxID=994086 RepID=A0A0C9WB51_9AGAM|nr:hypothetical protein HYDPIDRAFT_131707 [Hydnomerulius pinastri MD-312]
MRMAASRKAIQGSAAGNLCEVCGTKPKYVDANGATHSFCGRTCARNNIAGASPKSPVCSIRGCSKAEDPSLRGFCSADHAKLGVTSGVVPGCVRCRVLPQSNGQMCESCAKMPPDELRMWNINSSGTVWREFEREWKDKWQTGGTATIEKLFEVSYPSDVLADKDAFRQNLESNGSVRLMRTFHASQCICDMGTKGAVLCDWRSCGICNIVKSAFKGVAFGAPYNKGRHGNGLYSSSNPSAVDRHATSCLSSPYRVMIACDVVLPQNASKNNSILMGDGVVVRDSGAVTPRYIVMYTKGS